MITTHFNEIKQILILSVLVGSFKTIREFSGNKDCFIRAKCILSDGSVLEFAEYAQIEHGRIFLKTYNYHWQTDKGTLIKRWDNAPHHPEIKSFPDHLHNGDLITESKPMTLALVLTAIGNSVHGANR